MASDVQLRLFAPPQPLVEHLGADFFRRLPQVPGVYVMSDERQRVLYIGKAANLRQRLNSYRYIRPERASRKLVRLVHQVRAVTWERCACADTALLRENELLRLHKPRFNVLNVRPEHYRFVALRVADGALHLRLARERTPRPGETLHGAFKSLGRVRAGVTALLRLLWMKSRHPQSVHELPMSLMPGRAVQEWSVQLAGSDLETWAASFRQFLDGHNDDSLRQLRWSADELATKESCLSRWHEADLEAAEEFHRFGPARNRRIRDHIGHADALIAQTELDDFIVLAPSPKATRESKLEAMDEGLTAQEEAGRVVVGDGFEPSKA